MKPSRFVNPTSLLLSSSNNFIKEDIYTFSLNINLLTNVEYYCDINTNINNNNNNNLNNHQHQATRVQAIYMNVSTLKCNLAPIKAKLELMTRQNPIRRRFVNVSLQIRANTHMLNNINYNNNYNNNYNSPTPLVGAMASSATATSLTTSLIASASLFTFNCSYFTGCAQCLNKQLGNSCVWCAKNAKCIFSQHQQQQYAECPNEIEFYSTSSSINNNMCTSFSMGTSPLFNLQDEPKITSKLFLIVIYLNYSDGNW